MTRDRELIHAFRKEYGNIIVKPLYGNGGAGVFFIQEGDHNLASLLELFELNYREPFMIQRYLPEVRKGDKRILLVDGEPLCAVLRVPAPDEARGNLHVGAKPMATTLDDRGALPPDVHIFTASKLPWVGLPPEVPAFEIYYEMDKLWPAESLARRKAASATG